MRRHPPIFTRRKLLLLAGAAGRLAAFGEDFWNTKPPAQWDAAEIYRLMNHSPWAHPVELLRAGARVVVTWDSALPLRDARKTELPPEFADAYVIGVDGIPAGGHSPEYLRQFAFLRSTGKPKWTARASAAGEVIRTSAVYEFAFPQSGAPIGPDCGEVVFELGLPRGRATGSGAGILHAEFKPKEMLYRGALAL